MIARRCYDIIAHYVRRSAIKVSFGRKVYKIARMYEHHVVLLGIFHRLVKEKWSALYLKVILDVTTAIQISMTMVMAHQQERKA